jgi:hypothetical protein
LYFYCNAAFLLCHKGWAINSNIAQADAPGIAPVAISPHASTPLAAVDNEKWPNFDFRRVRLILPAAMPKGQIAVNGETIRSSADGKALRPK